MLNAKLVVVGGAKLTEVPLKQLPSTIGRGRDSTIALPHSLVSRQHCEIFEQAGQLYVKDLNSLNGTYLNNVKIIGTQPLMPNQLLTLGNVTFRAVYENGTDVEMPTFPSNGGHHLESPSTNDWQYGETLETNQLALLEPDRPARENSGDPGNIPIAERDTEHAVQSLRDDEKTESDSRAIVVDDELAPVEKSISLGAIGKLPQTDAAASFSGGIRLDSDSQPTPVETGEIEIDAGDATNKPTETHGSSLDSFLRKLPK